jgi:hypothetical protein
MKMSAQHYHEPNPERPAVHGMLMVGEARVLLSHLPMFHAPHDQQIILEASLSAPGFNPQKKYVDDRNATQTRIYTWVPKPFVLSDLLASRPAPPTMIGIIFRGHFERGTVAVAILTFAPIRLSNLVGIELGQNLIKPGGLNAPYWLVFPHYDVKNRVDLNFQFDQPLTDLIDEYIHEFRPAVLRGANGPYLFPGEGGSPRVANSFSWQITRRIEKAVGLRITVHQFRHAAAAIYLKHRPGDYETVRRVLAHRSIETTIKFYCGLQTTQATEQFGRLIRQQIKFDAIT